MRYNEKYIAAKVHIFEKIKHTFWSYKKDIQNIPDELLIENALIYADMDELDLLFKTFDYQEIKKIYIRKIKGNPRYTMADHLLSWYCFEEK